MNILLLASFFIIQTVISGDNSQGFLESVLYEKTAHVLFLEKAPIKIAAACALSLSAHYVLEFISTYTHEYGHGIASGVDYSIEMIPHNHILEPWHGACSFKSNIKTNDFIRTAGGPLAGIVTTTSQFTLLNSLNDYINNKSTNIAGCIKKNSPVHFFYDAHKIGKDIGTIPINQSISYQCPFQHFCCIPLSYFCAWDE